MSRLNLTVGHLEDQACLEECWVGLGGDVLAFLVDQARLFLI